MEALNKSMDTESIIREFEGCKFSYDVGRFLEGKDITFEVIDGLVCIKSKPVEHDISKKLLSSMIDKELETKSLACESFIEMRMLRGRDYGKDFLIPDVCVVNLSESSYGSNGMFLGIPKLIIEVMSSNRDDDTYRKRVIYEEMGIPEYWIVDLDGLFITQFVLKNGSYGRKTDTILKGCIKHNLCGLELDLEKFFKALKDKLSLMGKGIIS